MPTKMEVLVSREQIADGVARIGREITRDFAGESVILLGVLKGERDPGGRHS
jgi:hypoxanthine phosphoribosyltransferase